MAKFKFDMRHIIQSSSQMAKLGSGEANDLQFLTELTLFELFNTYLLRAFTIDIVALSFTAYS